LDFVLYKNLYIWVSVGNFMEEEDKRGGERRGKEGVGIRKIILNLIRVLLAIAFVLALMAGRNLIAIVAVLAFVITYWPKILKRVFGVEVPAEFEVIVILFLYGLFLFGKIQGFHFAIPFWSTLFNVAAAVALGFVGLAVMHALYRGDKIQGSPFVIAFFSFCFAVAVGAVWELFEYGLDSFLGFNLQGSGTLMVDLSTNIAGALVVSTFGYYYIKNGKAVVFSDLITRFIERNPKVFGENVKEDPSKGLLEMIKEGEGKTMEFKSSLRTNLHTKEIDKRIEHSVLKTVTAYLNSDGGTLLVGVSDLGEVIGTEHDMFPSRDSLGLHITNLIKNHIGNEFLPFIKFDLIPIDDKLVLRIDCDKSNRHVFLRLGDNEEFYVRNGPSSVKLGGNELVDYIKNNFFREEYQ
jgi:hypothetical protein